MPAPYKSFKNLYDLKSEKCITRSRRGVDWIDIRLRQFARGFVVFVLVFGLLTTAVMYGAFLYGRSPNGLGGGTPSRVILIFHESHTEYGWPFRVNSATNQSDPLDMLMQLNDGVLVRDPVSMIPVIVKSEAIVGIIGESAPLFPLATSTPTPVQATNTPSP
jgi:hypothetical protein